MSDHSQQARSGAVVPGLRVQLLGGFQLSSEVASFPPSAVGSQRLIALLALRDQSMPRTLVAGTLWPNVTDARSHASLRSALARLEHTTRDAVESTFVDLNLSCDVAVDLRGASALAHRLLEPGTCVAEADLSASAVAALSLDLLPGWYDDWVLPEVELWRQLRLHALEALSRHLVAVGRFGDAIMAALATVHAEPLRESAHAAVIHVHLAEGNQSEALRTYHSYVRLLHGELGLVPTSKLTDLVSGLVATPPV